MRGGTVNRQQALGDLGRQGAILKPLHSAAIPARAICTGDPHNAQDVVEVVLR